MPLGKATFMWLWNNTAGNRGFHSNCVDVEIQGSSDGSIMGVAPLIANYGTSSLLIAESSDKDNDQHEAFGKRKAITVTVPKK